ncbi:glycosyltransferase family 2 protein [Flavobacterium sp. 14A]|uniref:glycosyltransferase n=1 Tax=Flavobacterium sp. 14A TaxID=2735896 RepID=UPI00156DF764|nr:glycosyltransferase family 2 protein [Flavobacterium sp. 14A]NRT10879.1 glycosyltransferase involved in cell wall biosynthesis [Flavobacterium sp. 14A]
MNYYLVIPAHNEATLINLTLQSLVSQTVLPKRIVVVNDNSTDNTEAVVNAFAKEHPYISLVNKQSTAIHLPGSKVIQAFNAGFATLDEQYDIIMKIDADLIFPKNYIETLSRHFNADPKIGMVGGFCYIEKDGKYVLENLTDKDHIRGALKAYRKEAFKQIGGLKSQMGWDTVDELLCKFYNWKVVTDASLQVKHLKPTGANYNRTARFKQGEAFYTLGYGFLITAIASAKLSFMKKKPLLFFDYIQGFFKAKRAGIDLMVTKEEALFIRNYRLKKMKEKLF